MIQNFKYVWLEFPVGGGRKRYKSETTCMVNDQQVKRLWQLAGQLSLEIAAAKSGMDPKTARKYLGDRRLPSEMRGKHTWRTILRTGRLIQQGASLAETRKAI